MKKVLLAAIAGMVMMFSGCKSGGGDPKTVLAEFFTLLSKKDIAGARKLATADSKSMLDMMEMSMKTETKEFDKYGDAKMEYGEAKIEGDKATVPTKEKETGETTNFILKKEGGSWKVAFDKATFMGMAAEKMGDKNINLTDSITNAMEDLKQMNTDSLSDVLKEGSKAMDSAAKALEELNKK